MSVSIDVTLVRVPTPEVVVAATSNVVVVVVVLLIRTASRTVTFYPSVISSSIGDRYPSNSHQQSPVLVGDHSLFSQQAALSCRWCTCVCL